MEAPQPRCIGSDFAAICCEFSLRHGSEQVGAIGKDVRTWDGYPRKVYPCGD